MSLRYSPWFWLALSLAGFSANATTQVERLVAPAGFHIEVLTDRVPNARQMAISASGILFVGSRREGKVYAVLTQWAGHAANPSIPAVKEAVVITVASGLTMPSGIAFKKDDLYVGAVNRVLRYPGLGANPHATIQPEVVTDTLPDKRHHGWKYLAFGPDGNLYLPIGAPCNICLSDDPRFTSILSLDTDTGQSRIIATGVRNSVGLAWHPETGELWFSDNGRDQMGDDQPPDEINRLTRPGSHYGYPYIHAGTIPDPEFGKGHGADEFTPPVILVQAHSAVTGITFYDGNNFPRRYHNALFVAEHGSWNRSKKVGYQVSIARLDRSATPGESNHPNTPLNYQPFITGWLKNEENWGRPNDVLVAPDGSLLISDDQAGAIYRVSYEASAD